MKKLSGKKWLVARMLSKNFKTKLMVAFIAFLILPSMIVGALSFVSASQQIRNQIEESAEQAIIRTNFIIDSTIEPKVHDAEYFAERLKGNRVETEEQAAKLEEFLSNMLHFILKQNPFFMVRRTVNLQPIHRSNYRIIMIHESDLGTIKR
uniref:Uncharacterized protein n=1 Tax=Paenibacillus polymyxa TaxID=1406 RepID=A0AAE9PS59_PAEPO